MSGLTLIIGNKNYSSWSLRPWLFMRQNHITFTEKRVPLYTPDTDAELVKYGSDYKVPVLMDGELIVWDSLAILEYLSEHYLEGAGWPTAPSARAIARAISSEMHSSYSNLRSELPMNCRKNFHDISLSEKTEHDVQRVLSLWRHCRGQYGAAGEWLFGGFSIADAMFAPVVLRLHGYNIPVGDVAQQYMQTVLDLPALQEWIDSSKAETEIIDWAEKQI